MENIITRCVVWVYGEQISLKHRRRTINDRLMNILVEWSVAIVVGNVIANIVASRECYFDCFSIIMDSFGTKRNAMVDANDTMPRNQLRP